MRWIPQNVQQNIHDILNKINLHVKPGENIAIVGPSGGGKSTLCHLVPRFYNVTEGKITLDGVDTMDITLNSLRRNIGIVSQTVFLFDGTVRDNIAYGTEGASEEEIIAAANAEGNHIPDACCEYILPLIEGEAYPKYERGLPK